MAKKISELTEEELKLPPLPEIEEESFFSKFFKKSEKSPEHVSAKAKVPLRAESLEINKPLPPKPAVKIKIAAKKEKELNVVPIAPKPPEFTKPDVSLFNRVVFGIKRANPFRNIEPEFQLWLSNGVVVKNLRDLAKAVREMDNVAFSNHANNSKNDFADWIRDIVKEEHLSVMVREAGTKEQMSSLIEQFEKEKPKKKKQESSEMEIEKAIEKVRGIKQKIKPVPIKPIETPEVLFKPSPENMPLPKPSLEVPPPPVAPEITIETKLGKMKKEEKIKEEPKVAPSLETIRKEEKKLLEEEKALEKETGELKAFKLDLSEKRTEFMEEVSRVGKEEAAVLGGLIKPAEPAVNTLSSLSSMPAFPIALPPPEEAKPDKEAKKQPSDKINAIMEMLNEAHNKFFNLGDFEGAKKILAEANELLSKTRVKADEKRRINYDIIDLETNIKLAALG